jgi:hypothetical protein
MHRSRFALGFLLTPILFTLVVSTLGCGGSSEETIVRKFFAASRMRDNVTLGGIATVVFDPKTDGQVETFSFVSETPEQTQALDLKAKAAAFKEAQKADDAFTAKKNEYQKANLEAIDRVLKAEKASKKLAGRDADVQKAWTKWRDDLKESSKKVSDARKALGSDAAKVTELSMQNPMKPVDVTDHEGTLATKEMTISAKVRTPDEQSARKTLIVTLQQGRLKANDGGADIVGKWVITKVKEAAGGA